MRAIAVLLLVMYHVIGSNGAAGLGQEYPEPLRLFADFLIDIRMPFFAFIAGYVYGLRPMAPGHYPAFIQGKFRRLYVPGAIAAALYAICAGSVDAESARSLGDFWEIFFFPYVHYWFLQGILVIFVVFGAVDAASRSRAAIPAFLLACALSLADPYVPGNPMSVNQAIYLAPFFLLGLVFVRHRSVFTGAPTLLATACLIVVLICSAINLSVLQETGRLSMDRQDLQSLAMGLSICLLAILVLPHVAQFELLGPYAFTIYLYHVFGTAGMRRALHAGGIESVPMHLVMGLAAGLILPVAIHVLADRHPATRRLVLGMRG